MQSLKMNIKNMNNIPFNKPVVLENENKYIAEAISGGHISGDGDFTKRCTELLAKMTGALRVMMTTSCSHALDMAAILLDIKEGDEVIMPSFTFVSTANAFVLRGAKIIFVDIRPDNMNIDETKIESAITSKTKAIVPVHYAGVACEMDTIMAIAEKYNLFVVEDAAQGVMSTYKGKALGSIGHIGAFSFHETKNYTSGEGGALIINDERFSDRAEIIREKGTNRSQFFRGQIDKYSWVDMGSSFLPSELNMAYLYPQLLEAEAINNKRLTLWNRYNDNLKNLNSIELPFIPSDCVHNAHMFYLKFANLEERTDFINYMKENGVSCVFHYIPLHSALAGKKFGVMKEDKYTTLESERLVRLPMYYELSIEDVDNICSLVKAYINK